jgi:hypothetical protein
LRSLREVQYRCGSGSANVFQRPRNNLKWAGILRTPAGRASALCDRAGDHRVADYQRLLNRAIANLPSASTAATRHAIYERARKAQLAQIWTVRPPLPESDIAQEEEALDQAIALVEAKFDVPNLASTMTTFAATTSAAVTRKASAGSAPAEAARTEVPIPPLPNLVMVASPGGLAEKSTSWPLLALAAVLGIVLAITCAAIVMPQKPRFAVAPFEAQEGLRPGDFRWPRRGFLSPPPEDKLIKLRASVPPGKQLNAQSGSEAADQSLDASSRAFPETARAAMVIGSDSPLNPEVSLGSTVWSTILPAPGQPARVAVKADADIPDLKMHATMTLRKNTDPTLQATHTIDLKFSFAEGASITGVNDVEPKMRNLGSTASETLRSFKVKISDVYFLIALAKGDQDAAHNLDLMQTRAWFDFPLLLKDNRIAKLVFEKSTKGEAMLAKAFEAWK